MVVPAGIEPATRGFSVLCSTDWATEPSWRSGRGSNPRPPPWQGGILNQLNYQTKKMVEPRRIELLTSCVQSRRSPSWAKAPSLNGREDRIWTCDPLVPNQVHYQAVLLPVNINGALGRNRTGTEFEVRRILSPVRLPVSPPGHTFGGSNRTWTDDRRVAVFCLTNLAMEPFASWRLFNILWI